jgi:hypothetical protein
MIITLSNNQWLHISWIYNYPCNQCISLLKLWIWIPFMAMCTRHQIMWWLVAGRWFSPGTPVSSTNQTDRYDINEILLKVAFNTITSNNQWYFRYSHVINMTYFLGLDPADPLFYKFDPAVKIDSQDVVFVDIIHTDWKREYYMC